MQINVHNVPLHNQWNIEDLLPFLRALDLHRYNTLGYAKPRSLTKYGTMTTYYSLTSYSRHYRPALGLHCINLRITITTSQEWTCAEIYHTNTKEHLTLL